MHNLDFDELDFSDVKCFITFTSFMDFEVYKILDAEAEAKGISFSEHLNDYLRSSFQLSPLSKPRNGEGIFTTHWWDSFQITRNKTLHLMYGKNDIKKRFISKYRRIKGDHGGFEMSITVFARTIILEFNDRRHWNEKANRYYKDGEENPGHGPQKRKN